MSALTEENVRSWLETHVHRTFHPTNNEFTIMLELLQKHPNYENWTYQEITAFRITRSAQKKALQVEIEVQLKNKRKWRLVSWKACVSGQQKNPDSDMKKLNSAMRYAIRKQISMFRKNNPIKKCAMCSSYANIEVDHDTNHKSFKTIRNEFIEKHPDTPTNFTFAKYNYRFQKADQKYKRQWQLYHNRNAVYRYLCAHCNQTFK